MTSRVPYSPAAKKKSPVIWKSWDSIIIPSTYGVLLYGSLLLRTYSTYCTLSAPYSPKTSSSILLSSLSFLRKYTISSIVHVAQERLNAHLPLPPPLLARSTLKSRTNHGDQHKRRVVDSLRLGDSDPDNNNRRHSETQNTHLRQPSFFFSHSATDEQLLCRHYLFHSSGFA
jgi:hypothetical protein